MRAKPPNRADYSVFRPIATRWADNDIYGHINNVEYYAFFDTVVNGHLIEHGVLDIHNGNTVGLVVETKCNYFAPLAFPDLLEGGLRVDRIGTSSVQYGVAIFRAGSLTAAAAGHFIHVYVDRGTQRPVPLPKDLWATLHALVML
jgi:acyl-CoA thioester hydrolase